jgi:hypothetical protein
MNQAGAYASAYNRALLRWLSRHPKTAATTSHK